MTVMNPMTWPLWLRCQLAGLTWVAIQSFLISDDGPRTVLGAVPYAAVGGVLGLTLWALIRVHERRLFGDLSGAERSAVLVAVRTARPPDDPRLGDAAVRVARRGARRRMGPVSHAVFFGLFVLLSIYLVVSGTTWAWFGVLFWPLTGWYSWRTEQRERRAAERYLHAAGAAAR